MRKQRRKVKRRRRGGGKTEWKERDGRIRLTFRKRTVYRRMK
jgi:hypothetical protein